LINILAKCEFNGKVICGIIDQVRDTTWRVISDSQNPDEQRASNPNQPLGNQEIKPQPIANRLSQRITNAAGVEQLEGFRLGEMFSEVFKKHTDDEVEAYFTVGTAETIPDIIQYAENSASRKAFAGDLFGDWSAVGGG
jgi:hypothetical protein